MNRQVIVGGADRRAVAFVAAVAIVLTALNLRPAVPSVGALLPDLQHATGMSATVAGVLTTLPPLCFGVFGLFGGWLGRRLGTTTLLLLASLLTVAGLAARVATDRPWLILLFTVPALAGLALGNVLLPVAVRAWFPAQVGWVTGWYALAMSVGMAVAAGVSVPIAQVAGTWRAGLGVWAVTPLVVIPAWLWLRRHGEDGPATPIDVPPPLGASLSISRNRQAWALTGYFGLQSFGAYVVFGWLPTIYRDADIDPRTAALLLALVIVLGAPISLIVPRLATRHDDQRILVLALGAAVMSAYAGLLLAPASAPWLWATLLGIGMGSFPLGLVLIGLRAVTSQGTAQLSSLTLGVGYLVGAGGPLAIGALHDATHGWMWPLAALIALLVPQLALGLIAAQPGFVDRS